MLNFADVWRNTSLPAGLLWGWSSAVWPAPRLRRFGGKSLSFSKKTAL